MSIISQISFKKLFKTTYKASSYLNEMPDSAKRVVERSNQPRPYTINRDAHGTRPWHSYKSSE
jgi:hypothetical protein